VKWIDPIDFTLDLDSQNTAMLQQATLAAQALLTSCGVAGATALAREISSEQRAKPAPILALSLSLSLSREWPPAHSFAFAESDDIEGDARHCDICLVQLASYSAARECDVCGLVCCGNCALEVSSHGELLVRCTICENDAEDEDETSARARAFDWSEASEPESP
jgi:hypothetical protein